MDSKPVPSAELSTQHLTNLDLVGTVGLPSPFPATARIFVVRHPGPKSPDKADKSKYHIKIVQTINESHIVTRYVSPKYVRLIRLQSQKGEPAESATPTLISSEQMKKDIRAIKWDSAAVGSHEAELYPGRTGVVFVPEDAPVILRHEHFVAAAMSLEHPITPQGQCPHHC